MASEIAARFTRYFRSATRLSFLFTLMPASAFAAIIGNFSCSNGQANGTLYDTGAGTCPTTMQFTNVISFLVCHTEQLSANLMGGMYCGIVAAMLPAVTAMVTLAVVLFGVSFTIGFSQVSARDFQGMLLKIALVLAFATQSDYIIGIGYNLLVTGLRDGTAIAVSSLYQANGTPTNGLGVYGMLDKFLAGALHFATDAVGQTWDSSHSPCKNAIFAVMAIMAVVLPPVFYLCIILVVRICLTFMRAVFCYLYSLIGITFLLSLSPFFLSFYLFKVTRGFFDKWVSYLISCSLQIVITFAFLAFVVSIKVDNISHSFTDIIMPQAETHETTGIRLPWNYCTVCQFQVVDATDGSTVLTNPSDYLSKGKLQCTQPQTPLKVLDATAPSPPSSTGSGSASPTTDAQANTLISFATHGLVALVVLAYIVDTLLNAIPRMAKTLSVGFDSGIGMPGSGIMSTVQRSFSDSFNKIGVDTLNSPMAAVEGFKTAAQRLIVGERNADGSLSNKDPGIVGGMVNFLKDPLQRGPDDTQ